MTSLYVLWSYCLVCAKLGCYFRFYAFLNAAFRKSTVGYVFLLSHVRLCAFLVHKLILELFIMYKYEKKVERDRGHIILLRELILFPC